MKINSIDKDISDILNEGYFRIPRFQRAYSWDRENISEFWTDAIVDSSLDYFIGSMVVYKGRDGFGIVDGHPIFLAHNDKSNKESYLSTRLLKRINEELN